jgi:hypothetical protein
MNIIVLKQELGYQVSWDKNSDTVFTSHNNKIIPQKWEHCSCIKNLECGTIPDKYIIHQYLDEDEEINWDCPIELKLHNASKIDEISLIEALCFTCNYKNITLLNELRHGHSKLKELLYKFKT